MVIRTPAPLSGVDRPNKYRSGSAPASGSGVAPGGRGVAVLPDPGPDPEAPDVLGPREQAAAYGHADGDADTLLRLGTRWDMQKLICYRATTS